MAQTQEIQFQKLKEANGGIAGMETGLREYHLDSADSAGKLDDLDRLLSIVIHQIRNHCMSIKGYTSILNHEEGISDRGMKWLSKISRGIVSLENFLADFEKYRPSRVRNDQVLKVAPMVKHAWHLLGNILDMDIERIKLDIDVEDDAKIIIDRNDFMKMLYQLMKNSVESIEGKGRLTVSYREKTGHEGHIEWILEISDNGCGMDENELQRAGEILHSLKQSHIGCGLNLVSAVAERIGAEIDIRSAVGAGTAVRIFKG